MAGLRGRLGPWDDLATARTGARTHRHMRHGPMDWTVGTFWTMGKDALDTGDRLWTAWTPGTDWRPLLLPGCSWPIWHYIAAKRQKR